MSDMTITGTKVPAILNTRLYMCKIICDLRANLRWLILTRPQMTLERDENLEEAVYVADRVKKTGTDWPLQACYFG